MRTAHVSNRRSFLKASLLSTTALAVPARFWAAVPGANDDVRLAVIGFGGRGGNHIDAFSRMKGVRLVALCDCDARILDGAARRLRDKGQSVETYSDVRKLLANPNIDAISTATPNHWHSLITVWACQAGKDVYVEKPISHNVWEGRQAVEAARKYSRIVQAGTQSRSMACYPEAWAWLKAGNLGRIKIARGLCYKRRASIGKVDGPQPIPDYIDYDLWCGPALKLPLMRKNLHYDWHWVWNTGNGDMGNQGIHEMDKCRWALGQTELPRSVFSVGGRLGYVDDGETANTQMCVFDYGQALLIFETRGLPSKTGSKDMDKYRTQGIGQVIECEGGWTDGHAAYDNQGKEMRQFAKGEQDHFANFIKAVRSRNRADLNGEILEGHLSSALCHLGNLSHRMGRQADPDEIRQSLTSNPAAVETLGRMEEHLAANGVDIKQSRLTLGPVLRLDAKAECFVDQPAAGCCCCGSAASPDPVPPGTKGAELLMRRKRAVAPTKTCAAAGGLAARANELLTRPYRAGFVVPAKV